ncbi:MAG: ATP-binding protein [Pirellulaceae bacterium]
MAEAAWSWHLCERIPSSKDAGHAAIEKLLAAMEHAGWDGRDFFHVQMAVEEAVVNAITHGNHEADDKSVELDFKVSASTVYLRIKDEGSGFCPSKLPDPRDEDHLECTNGRGVLLIRELMTDVHYNQIGNQVVMTKRRAG